MGKMYIYVKRDVYKARQKLTAICKLERENKKRIFVLMCNKTHNNKNLSPARS